MLEEEGGREGARYCFAAAEEGLAQFTYNCVSVFIYNCENGLTHVTIT